ncbi:hypothetical protein SPADD19_01394 [Streptococcus parasanguinis]|uniref:hypothetical protein n=1 Tax=Streptococcus parasanguinis TaxID=1318 RepID=UPI000B186798|nr:hypothetical protein [Streptococcus parasanguinis]KXT87053.1 hypothetical protein SPADD19_01394 [Streptococcus parasanguinis]
MNLSVLRPVYSTVRGQDYEIETASTDFCLLAQWLIGTTPTYGTRTSYSTVRGQNYEIKLFELLISVSWRSG